MSNLHNIIKQCVFFHVDPKNITIDAATKLVQIQFECALAAASYGYILGVHMNKRALLNNVMWVAKGNCNVGYCRILTNVSMTRIKKIQRTCDLILNHTRNIPNVKATLNRHIIVGNR